MTPAQADLPGIGFLTDFQIQVYLNRGLLIRQNTWEVAGIRHASYTVRLGDRVEVARANRANTEDRRDFVLQDLRQGDHLDLSPGDTAKLYSLEHLVLPDDILAFTVARGLMFFESLLPENTYADPGFAGPLYTTVTNLSHRVVRLQFGDPIARIFFYRLSAPVREPFVSGSTRGVRQRLDSTRATAIGTADECRNATTDQILDQLQHLPIGGTQFVELWGRHHKTILSLFLFATCWPPLLLLANLNPTVRSALGAVVSNIAAVIVSAGVSLIGPPLLRMIRKI